MAVHEIHGALKCLTRGKRLTCSEKPRPIAGVKNAVR